MLSFFSRLIYFHVYLVHCYCLPQYTELSPIKNSMKINGSYVIISEQAFKLILFFMAEFVLEFPVNQEILGVTPMWWGVEFLFSLSTHL